MIVQEDCIEDIAWFIIEEWYLMLWLEDDPETEEFFWNIEATIDGYHSIMFKDHSLLEVLNKAVEYCKHHRWTEIW